MSQHLLKDPGRSLGSPPQLRAVGQADFSGPLAAGAEHLGQGNLLEWGLGRARWADRLGWRPPASAEPIEKRGRSDAMSGGELRGRSWAAFKLVEKVGPLLSSESLTSQGSVIAFHSPVCNTNPPRARQMGHR